MCFEGSSARRTAVDASPLAWNWQLSPPPVRLQSEGVSLVESTGEKERDGKTSNQIWNSSKSLAISLS
jgi:hypothetical protein